MEAKKRRKLRNISIGTRLIILFVMTSIIIYIVNIYMYFNINKSIESIDRVFVSNANLNELSEVLDDVHGYMYEYLNTKSSEGLKSYYSSFEEYNNLVYELNNTISDNETVLMERKIRNMSLEYLKVANATIQGKRGRNIEKYNENYEEANKLFEYISANIYSLNNQQFRKNSNNYTALLESLKYMELVNMIILFVIGILNLILIIIMTNSITSPLKRLAVQANEVASGNFDIEFDKAYTNDEIGIVSKAFEKMIINIRDYIKQIKDSMEYESKLKENELIAKNLLKDAQLKYLHAQINPHFLFNTLNAGAQLAMIEDADKTSIFIEKTAEFFRYNIRKLHQDAYLKEEVELVDNYIHIMSIRFFKDINFVKRIDETLLDLKVPSMILQPLVENAINYGIRDIDWKGKIELSIYGYKGDGCISVYDNGIGLTKEEIEEIMKGESKEADLATSSNGIGLKNVINRLNLYFGRSDLLSIHSEGKGRGTEVKIIIPKR